MSRPDLNLLVTLDVLLAEGSVARAAQRLRLSASAMSRALARLRETTGDPLLVKAGRVLVPTPRAVELRERVSQLVQESESVLRPTAKPDATRLVRTFTLRASDGFVENFGARLVRRIGDEAPGVRLRFVSKANRDGAPLRGGGVDLETGVVGKSLSPEIRAQALFRDRWIGVVRHGHPFAKGAMTAARFAGGRHVAVSRRGIERGPVDDALAVMNKKRNIGAMVDGFAAALALVRGSELIATVPERHTESLRTGLHSFALPFACPTLTVSLLWHPRQDADPAHRWFRAIVRDVCLTGSQ